VLNELRVQLFPFGSFAAFSITAEIANYDTSYWTQKLSLGSSIQITDSPGSYQMRKARCFEYAKVRLMSTMMTIDAAHLIL